MTARSTAYASLALRLAGDGGPQLAPGAVRLQGRDQVEFRRPLQYDYRPAVELEVRVARLQPQPAGGKQGAGPRRRGSAQASSSNAWRRASNS